MQCQECTSCFPVGYSYWLKEYVVESLNFCIGFSHESTFVCNEKVHGLPFAFHSNFQENLGAKSTKRRKSLHMDGTLDFDSYSFLGPNNHNTFIASQIFVKLTKGQLISKGNFSVFNSPKKRT